MPDDPQDLWELKMLLWRNVECYLRYTRFEDINFDLLIERLEEVRGKYHELSKMSGVRPE